MGIKSHKSWYYSTAELSEPVICQETHRSCIFCDGLSKEDMAWPTFNTAHENKNIQCTCPFGSSVAAETWTSRAEDTRMFESFHMKYQRQIIGIRWPDHVRNIDVANQTGLPSVREYIIIRHNSTFDACNILA